MLKLARSEMVESADGPSGALKIESITSDSESAWIPDAGTDRGRSSEGSESRSK